MQIYICNSLYKYYKKKKKKKKKKNWQRYFVSHSIKTNIDIDVLRDITFFLLKMP